MEKLLPISIVALILLSVISLAMITVYSSQGISDSIRINIDADALKILGLKENYVVASALLIIPGVGIFDASSITHDSRGLTVIFDKHSMYKDMILRISLNDSFKTYLPTVFLQLRDYDNGKVYNMIISSYTINILDYAKMKNYHIGPNDMLRVKEITLNNWLSLLERSLITISEEDMSVMRLTRLAQVENLNKLDQDMLVEYGIIDKPSTSEITVAELEEFPYPGADLGIYREVNWTKYYEYTSSIPQWWINGFVESDGDPDEDEDYYRFVEDLLASKYYIEKSRYTSINQFLPILRNLIASEERNPNIQSSSINMIALEQFVGKDYWNNSKANAYNFIDIPLYRYYVNNLVSVHDANKFIVTISLGYYEVTTTVSGLLFAGQLFVGASNNNIGNKYISEVIPLGESSKRMGTLWIKDALITYGDDVILVEWIVDDVSSEAYYIVTPIVTVIPVYTVFYDANSFTVEYSSGDDPFYSEWSSGQESSTLLYRAESNPVSYPVEIWNMYVEANSSSAQMSYDALIDSPPFLGVVINMIGSDTNHPVAQAISKAYSMLSSVGYISFNVSATALVTESKILQTNNLSSNVEILIQVYYPKVHNFITNYNYGENEFANLVIITLTYSEP